MPGLTTSLPTVLVVLTLPAAATGQAFTAGSSSAVGGGFGYEAYRFGTPEASGIRELSLLTLPWAVRSSIGDVVTIGVSGGYAAGRLVRDGGDETTLTGLTDTEVRVGFGRSTSDFSASVQAIAVLPTGEETHTGREALVAGAIAADLLPFRIVNWGTGGGLGGAVTAARPFAGGSVGFNVSYLAAREFEPIQDGGGNPVFAYRPGDQLQLRAALDRNLGSTGKLTVSLSMHHHRADRIDGVDLYRTGNRYQALGSYAFAVGAGSSAIVYGGLLHRDGGTALADFSRDIPAQDLVLLGGGLRIPLGGSVLLPSVDSRVFRTADGIGQGHLTGLGAALEVPLSAGFALVPAARLRYGQALVRRGLDSDITGADIGLSVRWGGGRR
jgi:hypothetical protein